MCLSEYLSRSHKPCLQTYSGGESERILGKAIKELKLPREEIVVMTKVYFTCRDPPTAGPKGKTDHNSNPDEYGYVNQHGLSRKVRVSK